MRALLVTNLYPSDRDPARGSFVRDQVRALRRIDGLEVDLFTFGTGGSRVYIGAARELARKYRGAQFDVIHAHFGLAVWPSLRVHGAPHAATLHGTDLVHPRSRVITLAGVPFLDLVGPVSTQLAELIPPWFVRGEMRILPCGVDTERFVRIDRTEARKALGLDEHAPYLLFPSNPARPEKRYDRASAVSEGATLLELKGVEPEKVPLWVNAANAVLVTSERESFGLAVLEALACDVPVLATPVGIAPEVLPPVEGTYCGEFDAVTWRAFLEPLLAEPDPRVAGRAAAEAYSAVRMAQRVADTWRTLV
jgi:teichuronic acid biosynthesis glycosyltransferase TuaC